MRRVSPLSTVSRGQIFHPIDSSREPYGVFRRDLCAPSEIVLGGGNAGFAARDVAFDPDWPVGYIRDLVRARGSTLTASAALTYPRTMFGQLSTPGQSTQLAGGDGGIRTLDTPFGV